MTAGALLVGAAAAFALLPGCAEAQLAAPRGRDKGDAADLLAAPLRSLDETERIEKPEGPAAAGPCRFERLYRAYVARFVSADGRVVDDAAQSRTTSEGQAYALVHALVADDRELFARLLLWTSGNLAGGELGARLPAWLWGRAPDGELRVLDANSASDADLWMAWALLEGASRWSEPALELRGKALLASIAAREVVDLKGLGQMLLPGAAGFRLDESGKPGRGARLNPSYLVLPLLRRMALASPGGPWSAVALASARVLRESAPRGFAPDWIAWQDGLVEDPVHPRASSYDAIRVPLWAGMIPAGDPLRVGWQQATSGLLSFAREEHRVPESVDAVTGATSKIDGPPGFAAALLPLARALDEPFARALQAQLAASMGPDGLVGKKPVYYDQNLALFALAWAEGRLRFDLDGRLAPERRAACGP